METWKAIKGFEKQYEVSNIGNVRSIDRVVKHYREGFTRKYKGTAKSLRFDKDGYLKCNLKNDGKTFNFRVHRLVGEAFIPNIDNKPVINHKNGIKTDNRVENLEWCTISENTIHATRTRLIKTKLTDKEALEIFNSNLSQRALAKVYNIDSSIVWRIKNKKAYKHLWQKHF
jgi:hypothetical protein